MITKRGSSSTRSEPHTRIPLGRERFAIVDPEDYEYLSAFRWTLRKSKSGSYAVRKTTHCGRRITIFMHREIMGADSAHQVHHINHNRLDNRKSNLQLVLPRDHARIELQYRITRHQADPPGPGSDPVQPISKLARKLHPSTTSHVHIPT